jgi:hypothetical protein
MNWNKEFDNTGNPIYFRASSFFVISSRSLIAIWGGVYKSPSYYYGLALIYDSQTDSFSNFSGNKNVADILYF